MIYNFKATIKMLLNLFGFILIIGVLPVSGILIGNKALANECPDIVSRDTWGARQPTHVDLMTLPVDYIAIHHTASVGCDTMEKCMQLMRSFQNYHMDTHNWTDIGYSFVIGGDGLVYEERGWDAAASRPQLRDNHISISLIGSFMNELPNEMQLNMTQAMINCAVQVHNYVIDDYILIGHRDMMDTSCPGDRFYEFISDWPHFHYNATVAKNVESTSLDSSILRSTLSTVLVISLILKTAQNVIQLL